MRRARRLAAGTAGRTRTVASLLALAFALVAAGDGPTFQVSVEAPPGLERDAAAVRAAAAGDVADIVALVGLERPSASLRIVLAPEGSPLASGVPSWVSGYALAPVSTIVLFPRRVPSYPDRNLATLLRHEVAHLLLARAAGGHEVPRWFDEGVATVAAREWGIEDAGRVALASIGPGPRSLAEVDGGFLGDGTSASRSYAVSAALVRYLLRAHGESSVARILAAVDRGLPFADAFRSTGSTLDDFARGYFGRETFWVAWVPFLTSTTALWMGITVLALLAIRRRRERDAALRAAWAEAERDGREEEVANGDDGGDGPETWN